MARYKLVISYDGTEFHGFQRLAGELRTVQGVLESALRRLGWEGGSIAAAGRTDAGVHARGQVVAFDLAWGHAPEDLVSALNAHLPADVAVQSGRVEADGFHPRFDAVRRRYRYSVFGAERRDPLRERHAWRVWPALDRRGLQRAVDLFVGRRDFAAFGSDPAEGGNTVREVSRAEWQGRAAEADLLIEADAFLYHMVRKVVAACIEVEKGRCTLEEVRRLLGDPAERWQGPLAPAQGLCLESVIYAGEE